MATDYVKEMLGEREQVLLTARQHWFVLVGTFGLKLLLAGLILLAMLVSLFFIGFNLVVLVIGLVLLPVPTVAMARDALTWWHRQYVVTNRRVIQLSGILRKNVTDSSLEKVNDVKMSQTLLGRLFGYGDVEILTASDMGANLFRRIQNPILFKTTMLNAKEGLGRHLEEQTTKAAEPGEPVAAPLPPAEQPEDIPALIEQLDGLRRKGLLTDEEFQRKKTDLLARL